MRSDMMIDTKDNGSNVILRSTARNSGFVIQEYRLPHHQMFALSRHCMQAVAKPGFRSVQPWYLRGQRECAAL
jgi:hypothetical protein